MKTVSVDPEDLDLREDVEMSEALLSAVDHEMEYLEDREIKHLRMRCRRGSDEVYQATIHAGDEMYRLSEVSPGNVSRTVFRNPERKGDENLVGAPSEIEGDEPAEDDEDPAEDDGSGGSDDTGEASGEDTGSGGTDGTGEASGEDEEAEDAEEAEKEDGEDGDRGEGDAADGDETEESGDHEEDDERAEDESEDGRES